MKKIYTIYILLFAMCNITVSQNVGIGTSAPAKKLDVDGKVGIFGGRNNDPTIKGLGTSSWTRIGGNSGGIAFWGNNNVENDDLPQLFINNNGNVGIGNTDPKDLLQIGNMYAFHNGGSKGFSYNGYYDYGSSAWKYLQNGYWSGIFHNAGGGIDMYLGATGTSGANVTGISPGIHILNNGNVGIGEYTPSVRLDVNGSLRIRSAGDAAGNIRFDAANPYITSGGSYIHIQNGLYLYDASKPSYTEAPFNFRNTILNDASNFGGNLRIADNVEVTGDLAFFGMTANNKGMLIEATNTSVSTIRGENDIRFNIGNGAYPGTTWPEVMRITRSLRVGIGTNNPDHILHVKGSPVRFEKDAHAAGSDNYSLELFSPQGGSAGEISIRFHQSGRFYQQIRCRPGLFRFTAGNVDTGIDIYAAGFVTTSDNRVKSDKMKLEYGLKEIVSLKPMRYNQHSYTFENNKLELLEESKEDIGLIAQEVYELIPEAVLKPEDESRDIWTMNYPKLIPVLIKAIQEQQQQIEDLKLDNTQLKVALENKVDSNDFKKLNAEIQYLKDALLKAAK